MRCDNVERGCGWEGTVGTLDNHVTKCRFTLLLAQQCKVEGEESQVMRNDLDDHLKTESTCVYIVNRTHASIT